MKMTYQQIDALLQMLSLTQESEVACDRCLEKMSEFAEISLAGRTLPEGLIAIDDHLKICGECREEFEALKLALSYEVA